MYFGICESNINTQIMMKLNQWSIGIDWKLKIKDNILGTWDGKRYYNIH